MQKRVIKQKLGGANIPKLKEITVSVKRTVTHNYQTLSLMAAETHDVTDVKTDIPVLRRKMFNLLATEIDKIISEDLYIDIRPEE